MTELEDAAAVRAHYGEPSHLVLAKQLDHLDAHCKAFIALSPFVIVATSDTEGRCDASPRGDRPGLLAHVVDEKTLLLPDRTGNRRTDTMLNIAANPHAGFLFLVPGLNESLRVNGSVRISVEPSLLASLAVEGKPPMAVMVVTTEEVYFQCGKAVLRSELWNPERRIPSDRFPSLAKILADQVAGTKAEDLERNIDEGYRLRLY